MNEHEGKHECGCAEARPGDVIVCRCEEVYLSEIEQALKDGAGTLDELKRLTRAGMGLCQGRTCGRLTRAIFAKASGKPVEEVEPIRVRPPVRPVPLASIGKGVEEREFGEPQDESGREAPAYINEVFKAAYEGDGPIVL